MPANQRKRLAHEAGPDPARGAVLGDLFEEVHERAQVPADTGRKSIDRDAARQGSLDVLDGVGDRKRHLLHSGGSRLPDVIAADADGVGSRHHRRAVLEGVRHQAQRGFHREDAGAAREELLQDVVLDDRPQLRCRHALFLAGHLVQGQEEKGGRVDRERAADAVERDAVEEHLEVAQRIDRHTHPANFRPPLWMVGVVAHLGGQVQRGGEPGDALLLEQAPVPGVGLGHGAEPRVGAHRPELFPVHERVRPARVRVLAGVGQVALVIESRHVGRCVDRLDLHARGGLDWAPLFSSQGSTVTAAASTSAVTATNRENPTPCDHTFSSRMTSARTAIASTFMVPTATSTTISAQQQPRQ